VVFVQEFTCQLMTSALIVLNVQVRVHLVLAAFVLSLPALALVTLLIRAPDNIAMVPLRP